MCALTPSGLRRGCCRLLAAGAVIAASRAASFGQTPADPDAIGVGQLTGATAIAPITVPFDLWQGVMVLKAHVGEGPEVDVALDTALPICLASPDFARQRYLNTDGTRNIDLLDRTVRIDKAKTLNVRFDRVTVGGVPFGVFDLIPKLTTNPGQNAPQVWIGTSALAACCLTIDPRARQVQFRPAGSQISPTATTVPFELKDGRIWVDAKANDKQDFRAVIDTGAVGTLLPAAAVKSLKIAAAKTYPFTQANGKPGQVGAVQLQDVSLGGLKVTDVQAMYITASDKDGIDPDLGVIGTDVLMRYKITIDYGTRRLAFELLPALNTQAGAVANAAQNGQTPGAAAANASALPLGRGGRGSRPFPGVPPTSPSTGP